MIDHWISSVKIGGKISKEKLNRCCHDGLGWRGENCKLGRCRHKWSSSLCVHVTLVNGVIYNPALLARSVRSKCHSHSLTEAKSFWPSVNHFQLLSDLDRFLKIFRVLVTLLEVNPLILHVHVSLAKWVKCSRFSLQKIISTSQPSSWSNKRNRHVRFHKVWLAVSLLKCPKLV